MTDKYKLMQYFVVATLYFYRDNLVGDMSTPRDKWKEDNKKILEIVHQEGLKYFNYELSCNQVDVGILSYLMRSCKLEGDDK